MLLLGFIDASAPTLRRVLKVPISGFFPALRTPQCGQHPCYIATQAPGRAVLLAIGGAQEALLAWPGTYDIILNKRRDARALCCPVLICFGVGLTIAGSPHDACGLR